MKDHKAAAFSETVTLGRIKILLPQLPGEPDQSRASTSCAWRVRGASVAAPASAQCCSHPRTQQNASVPAPKVELLARPRICPQARGAGKVPSEHVPPALLRDRSASRHSVGPVPLHHLGGLLSIHQSQQQPSGTGVSCPGSSLEYFSPT